MLKLRPVKYVNCKHIMTVVIDPKDWEDQQVEVFRDIDGRKIGEAYLDYANCPLCQSKEVRHVAN